MASSSLLPALWVHRVSSPPPSLLPPPPPFGGLAATAGKNQHRDQGKYTGPGEGPWPVPSHNRFLRSTARPNRAGDGRSLPRSLVLWGSAPPLRVHRWAAGRPIFGESAARTASPVPPFSSSCRRS